MCYQFAVKPYVGDFYLANKLNIRDALTYGTRLTTCLSPKVGMEIATGLTPTEDTLGKSGIIIQTDGNLTFDLSASPSVMPYFTVGGGWVNFKNFSLSHNGGSINFGSGIKFMSSNRVIFAVEAKDYIMFNAFGKGKSHNLSATVGLTYGLVK